MTTSYVLRYRRRKSKREPRISEIRFTTFDDAVVEWQNMQKVNNLSPQQIVYFDREIYKLTEELIRMEVKDDQ